MTEKQRLNNVMEKVQSAKEALAHKAKEIGIKRILVSQKRYDEICIKAAAFETICQELEKEDKNWWERS